jgi:ribosomal protein S6
MSLYELTLVLKEKTKVSVPGKVITTKDWGVRDLAYPINGFTRGAYWHYVVELEPAAVKALHQSLKNNPDIIRYLLIAGKE